MLWADGGAGGDCLEGLKGWVPSSTLICPSNIDFGQNPSLAARPHVTPQAPLVRRMKVFVGRLLGKWPRHCFRSHYRLPKSQGRQARGPPSPQQHPLACRIPAHPSAPESPFHALGFSPRFNLTRPASTSLAHITRLRTRRSALLPSMVCDVTGGAKIIPSACTACPAVMPHLLQKKGARWNPTKIPPDPFSDRKSPQP